MTARLAIKLVGEGGSSGGVLGTAHTVGEGEGAKWRIPPVLLKRRPGRERCQS